MVYDYQNAWRLVQVPGILLIVYHNAFPSLVFMSVDRLSNGFIDEEIDKTTLGVVLTAVAAAAEMFAAFMDTVVIAVAMATVMDAMKGCMMPTNAAVESLTSGFTSAFKSSVPG